MTDDDGMDTNTTSAESETRTPPPRMPLVRPVEGRTIAGVAAGLANYLGLSVGLVRFGFIVAVLFGGLGLALYGAGWLLIRGESEAEPIAQRMIDNVRSGPSWIGIGLLILAAVIVLDNVTILSGSLLWAIVLVAAGYLLYRGDIPTGPRQGPEPTPSGTATPETESGEGDAGGELPPGPPAVTAPTPPPPPTPPSPPKPPSILGRLTIGVGLVALGIMAVIDNLSGPIDPQPRHYLALATVVLGIGLITGGFVGRARWMILLGIFVVPPLLASPAAEVDWSEGADRTVTPTNVSQLSQSYELAFGQYVFDLSEIEWDGQTANLTVDMAAGQIVVLVPEDVAITGRAQVSIGQIETPGGTRGGIGEISRNFDLPGDAGTLDLDLEMGAGSIEVSVTDGSENIGAGTVHTGLEGAEISAGDIEAGLHTLEILEDTSVTYSTGTGDITVYVAEDQNFVADAEAGIGSVTILGDTQEGFGNDVTFERINDPTDPVIHMTLQTGAGDITVIERTAR